MLNLILMLALTAPAPTLAAQDNPFPYAIESRTLKNGLRVIAVPTGMPNLVSLQIPVSTGSRHEVEPGKSGFAHFFEHMMFRGTKQVSKEAWNRALLETGASQNAYTSDDLTNYHTLLGKQDLERWIALEADRFASLDYSEDDFKTEARAVLGEYNKNSANPTSKLYEAVRDVAFDTHTYKHTTMGFLKDIEDMPNQYAYSKQFFERWYRPDNVTVIVAGDVQAKEVFRLVEKYFGPWKAKPQKPVVIPVEPAPVAAKSVHVPWASKTTPVLWMAFRTDTRFSTQDNSAAALDLLGDVAFGSESALYEQLVVRERKANEVYAFGGSSKDPGLFIIGAELADASHMAAVREAILQTCAALVVDGVPSDRVEDARRKQRLGFARTLDSTSRIAGLYARMVSYDRDPAVIDKLLKLETSVTPADVQRVARATFTDARRVTGTVTTGALPASFLAPHAGIAERVAKLEAPVALQLIEQPNPRSSLVTYRVQLRAGAVHDPKGKEGLARLAAQLVMEGATTRRSYAELNKAWAALGGKPEVIVDKERTSLSVTVPREQALDALALLGEQLTSPALGDADFARVRDEQREALAVGLKGSNDEELGKVVLETRLYVGPYGNPVLGTAAGLAAIGAEDVRRFVSQFYAKNRLLAGIAGGYGAEHKQRFARVLAALPETEAPKVAFNEAEHRPAGSGSALTIVKKDTRATAISYGFSLRERDGSGTPIDARVNRAHPDFAALWVATSYLGQHRNSTGVLFQTIREKRGLNYGDYAYLEAFPNGMYAFQPSPGVARAFNHFQVWIRPTKPQDAAFALKASLFELDKLRRDGIGAAEFEAVRGSLVRFLDHLTDTQAKRLGHDMDNAWLGLGGYAETLKRRLLEVTREQVNAAAARYLKTTDLDIVMVTADADAAARDVLAPVAPKPRYDSDKPELEAEDEAIANWKLDLQRSRVNVVGVDAVL